MITSTGSLKRATCPPACPPFSALDGSSAILNLQSSQCQQPQQQNIFLVECAFRCKHRGLKSRRVVNERTLCGLAALFLMCGLSFRLFLLGAAGHSKPADTALAEPRQKERLSV